MPNFKKLLLFNSIFHTTVPDLSSSANFNAYLTFVKYRSGNLSYTVFSVYNFCFTILKYIFSRYYFPIVGHALCVFIINYYNFIFFYCFGLCASVANIIIEYANGNNYYSFWYNSLFC